MCDKLYINQISFPVFFSFNQQRKKWQENQISYNTATHWGGDNAHFNISTFAVKISKTSSKKCPPKYEV